MKILCLLFCSYIFSCYSYAAEDIASKRENASIVTYYGGNQTKRVSVANLDNPEFITIVWNVFVKSTKEIELHQSNDSKKDKPITFTTFANFEYYIEIRWNNFAMDQLCIMPDCKTIFKRGHYYQGDPDSMKALFLKIDPVWYAEQMNDPCNK